MQVIETYGEKEFVLELGTMCTDCEMTNSGEIAGDPTEVAIVSKAIQYGIYKEKLYLNMERVSEIPFDSDRKLMTTIHKVGNRYRIITKGAVDVLLNRCTKIYKDEEIKSISLKNKNEILEKNTNMADKALRVLAVAYRELEKLPNRVESDNIENELTFVGLIRND